MALIGKECLNCGEKLSKKRRTDKHGFYHPLCEICDPIMHICPVCKNEKKTSPIQSNFNYFVSCPCGYYGRPMRNTQTGNHPSDYSDHGHVIPENKEQASIMKSLLRKELGLK